MAIYGLVQKGTDYIQAPVPDRSDCFIVPATPEKTMLKISKQILKISGSLHLMA